MNEDTSGEAINEAITPIVPPTPKKRNLVPVIMFIIVGALLLVSGIFLFSSVRNWIAKSRDVSEQAYRDNPSIAGDTASTSGSIFASDAKIYLDSANRFSFKYSKDLNLDTSGGNTVTLSKEGSALIILTPRVLSKFSVQDEVESKMTEIGYNDEAEITKIGSRAGYTFTFQNTTYMFFPLGLDSLLEIKIESADKALVDSVVQTIEFLPDTQTS